ncbi:PepSY-associated TM helix domain-containing protein [Tenacibaculum sp. SSH1-16]|uniref:PepSY-associated TM helix domain-containing protein n=1 Tax=Tenacibaculum sp. SSH1-16 TaxID=3136667 RepID=UPI0032C3F57A
MAKRVYNIMFHTHTISGIVISAALYVIFFTGSISFLRDEIIAWERNEPVEKNFFLEGDFDALLNNLGEEYYLKGRDISFYRNIEGQNVITRMGQSKDTLAPKKEPKRAFFYTNLKTFKKANYNQNYSLGEFFYRLHFFAQLNFYGRSGYVFAGLIAFFFLFAIITGIIVHWKKIVPNFYQFRPKTKWKTIWTDAHVALGVIGLPYQFIFAVTGAYLIIGYMVMLAPVQNYIFNDNSKALTEALNYEKDINYEYKAVELEKTISINDFLVKTKKEYPSLQLNSVEIFNYGDANMHVKVGGYPKYKDNFLSSGSITFKASDGYIVQTKDSKNSLSYVEGATNLLKRLHFGDFGGYGMKLIYLVLGFITCFVIISGVLIWLVARDKKSVPNYKRKFNSWLVNIYMAICLSLYPITALVFITVKCFSDSNGDNRKVFIYQIFFWGWLILSSLFIVKKDNYFTNKISLLLGSILGFLVPISNGAITGNWLWISWQKGYSQIFVVDAFWLLLSITSFSIFFKIKRNKKL